MDDFSEILAYLFTCILAYLHTHILAYLYTCILASLICLGLLGLFQITIERLKSYKWDGRDVMGNLCMH